MGSLRKLDRQHNLTHAEFSPHVDYPFVWACPDVHLIDVAPDMT